MRLTKQPTTSPLETEGGARINRRSAAASVRHIDRSVRDNPISAKLSKDGIVTLSGKNNGVQIQFVAAEWPKHSGIQANWIIRLTPFWDGEENFTLKNRLRDAMRTATNKVLLC